MAGRMLKFRGGSRDGEMRHIIEGNAVVFPDGERYRCTQETDATGNTIAVIERAKKRPNLRGKRNG